MIKGTYDVMLRLYLSNPLPVENHISIPPEKVRYLRTVLRCREGDPLIIFDGEGTCFKTTITRVVKSQITAEIIEQVPCDTESPLHIILIQGVLKGEKMDFVVQKATELGVSEIVPVVTSRSQVRKTKKTGRWRKISEEAAKQSGRSVIPAVHEAVMLPVFMRNCRNCNGLFFHEEAVMDLLHAVRTVKQRKTPPSQRNHVSVFIGPEGGFTEEERMRAKESGFCLTSLGRRILRAETAAISAVTLVQFLMGDMSQSAFPAP